MANIFFVYPVFELAKLQGVILFTCVKTFEAENFKLRSVA